MGIIYHAFDTTTGKSYVGQTGWTLDRRRGGHLRSKANLPFANALRKRSEAFVWTMLTSGLITQQDLDDAEIYWGTFFDCLVPSGYNLRLGQGHIVWADEERDRHSLTMKAACASPEVRARKSSAAKIAGARPEVKARRSAAQKVAQKRVVARPETSAKRSAAATLMWVRRKAEASQKED